MINRTVYVFLILQNYCIKILLASIEKKYGIYRFVLGLLSTHTKAFQLFIKIKLLLVFSKTHAAFGIEKVFQLSWCFSFFILIQV